MIAIDESSTIGEAFERATLAYARRAFLAAPAGDHRSYHQRGYEVDFATAACQVQQFCDVYRSHGFGHGHRVAMLLENRPEHFLYKLAFNTLGISCVPINPDYRASEIAYLLDHSEVDLAIVTGERRDQLVSGMNAGSHKAPIVLFEEPMVLKSPSRPRRGDAVTAASEASVLYTSGTTGRPKGCLLSHGYELESGAWYASRNNLATVRPEGERIYNPLPLYHANSSVLSFFCAMVSGSCQIQPDRFNPNRWWLEVKQTGATIAHYMGVIVPLLLAMPKQENERNHSIRFGVGSGVEPQLHAVFEERFGFPLIEIWGMTEALRVLVDHETPRKIGTRAFGRPCVGVEARVVDDHDKDVVAGADGELVVRQSEATPRRGFFSGYLKNDLATEEAWRGGWFHTGDTVRQDEDGMLHFVDRKKNIIRRSGENIAAAEVEGVLQSHYMVKQVAVLSVPDDLREEEVYACVVLEGEMPPDNTAVALFEHCYAQMAYFKTPGWIHFVETLPTTGTQKIQKHQIFPDGADPRAVPGVFDMRDRKKRKRMAELD